MFLKFFSSLSVYCICFEYTGTIIIIFFIHKHSDCLIQIHFPKRRATEIRFHIRHGKDTPIAVGWFVGDIVFKQCPCYIQGNRLRCNLRKPRFLFACQSDGFCPKRAKLQCIGNHIVKTKDKVALRAFREDRYLKLNDLFPPCVFELFHVVGKICPFCRGWRL